MQAVSYRFLDWVKERLYELSEGVLTAEEVFDEREQDLAQCVKLAVNKGLGLCVVLSLPDLRHVGDTPGDTEYEVSCEVWVFHNKALSTEVDSVVLTEHFFRHLAGSDFALPDVHLRANVKADGLQHDVNGVKQTHYFDLSYREVI